MPSVARSGWRRAKSSIADEVAARMEGHAAREQEILRQLTDVFKEIVRLSEEVSQLSRRVADLAATVSVQVDVDNQSTELLGRLLAQARARLDALEEAGQHA